MVQISIDIPDELDRKAKMLKIEISLLLAQMLKERIKKLEEIEHFREIVSKSKATDKDVEELTDKIKTAVWNHHKKKFNL